MKSRTLDSQLVFQQWRVLFQAWQQNPQAGRERIGLDWICRELQMYEGEDYPTFLHQCMYIVELYETGPVSRAVNRVIVSLHKRLRQWAEKVFDAEYRYEVRMRDKNDPSFWIVWDRQTEEVANIRGRLLDNLQTYKRARNWAAEANGLLFCEEKLCQDFTPHELLPENFVQCQVCRAQRTLKTYEIDLHVLS